MAKYEKAEFLHKYLFYLLYQYEGNVDGLPEGSTDVSTQVKEKTSQVYLKLKEGWYSDLVVCALDCCLDGLWFNPWPTLSLDILWEV